MALPVLNAAQMRELDRTTIEDIGIPGPVLMEIAGRGCAQAVEDLLGGAGHVLVVCGKGNNGGDGLVAARHLAGSGYRVDILLLAEPGQVSGDAALNLGILRRLNIPVQPVGESGQLPGSGRHDIIIDAILGTGLKSEVRGLYAQAIDWINGSGLPVVAVDVPSGISSDNGRVLGRAVRAAETVTFGELKPGLVFHPGAAHAGRIRIIDIGIPPGLLPEGPGGCWLLEDQDLLQHLRPRPADAHKGRFGHLLVLAGSADKPGAAGLCCRAAVHGGAGLVTLAAPPAVLQRVVSGPVEYMGVPVEQPSALLEACTGKQAVAIGPGLGTDGRAAELVQRVVEEIDLPLVVDADGLNNLAGKLELVAGAEAERVLTPHPGEAARLLECSTADIQRDRLAAARRLAAASGAVVVLKGARTVVADPEKTAWVVAAGNPGMASGGTGDVLTGVIGSLLAQGLSARDAACCGALWHGLAGDLAVARVGEQALAANLLIDALGPVLLRLQEGRAAGDAA